MLVLLVCGLHFMLEFLRFEIAAKVKQNIAEGGIIGKRPLKGWLLPPTHPVGMLVMLTVKYIFN